MPDIGFLNGRFLPLAQTLVSVEDRGFQFGDGVYEVVRTYHGVPFQLDAHLARLERSAEAIGLAMPYQARDWREFVAEGLKQGGYEDSKVYIQVTRGAAPRDHVFPAAAIPTVVMTVRAMKPLAAALRTTGVGVLTMEDPRWGRCDIKSVNLLPNVIAKQRAKEAGAFEAIFVRDGLVTEGAVSNVMVARNGRLFTAPEGPRILSGVTRAVVLALARKEGLTVEERSVSLDDMQTAGEVMLTGTTVEVLPVVRVDRKPIGTGQPGPVTQRLYARFTEVVGLG
jgi:D-alanine transaminase